MVTSKDGLKAQQEYSAEDCAAIMVTSKDGLKAQQEYRTDDCCTILCAIFLFGLRPAIACNIGYCTLRWAIFLLGLRPVIAHKDKRKIILLHR